MLYVHIKHLDSYIKDRYSYDYKTGDVRCEIQYFNQSTSYFMDMKADVVNEIKVYICCKRIRICKYSI